VSLVVIPIHEVHDSGTSFDSSRTIAELVESMMPLERYGTREIWRNSPAQ
jgi:hypothetical protein